MKRRWIIPILAFLSFVVGIAALFIPFLPFGWLFCFVTILLLLPYFKVFKTVVRWLAKHDKTGIIPKACQITANLYRWAKLEQYAREIERLKDTCARPEY